MSRSYRHTPIIGNCSHSDKPGKAKANRKLRVAERSVLAALSLDSDSGSDSGSDKDGLLMPILREVSNVWDFPKDGKHYMKRHKEAWCRKYMRK